MTPDDRDLFQLPTGFFKARLVRFLQIFLGFISWMFSLAGGIYFGAYYDEYSIWIRLGGVVIGFFVGAALFLLVRWQANK